VKVGDIANADAAPYGKPLDGIRVLAAEQMAALPFATQLLARLGADLEATNHRTRGRVMHKGLFSRFNRLVIRLLRCLQHGLTS